MLGLIGTASGLALMFRGKLDHSDTQQIALGIAEALNTTIFGLCVTVPCVIAQSVFARRLDRLSARLELALSRWVEVCHQASQPKS
jgi:biopolymer transport protein ExbB